MDYFDLLDRAGLPPSLNHVPAEALPLNRDRIVPDERASVGTPSRCIAHMTTGCEKHPKEESHE